MRIAVCYKCVPDDQGITVKGDRTLDFSDAQMAISRYDLEAVEAAVRLSGDGDEVIAMTYAGAAADNSKLRKAILSRGPSSQAAIRDASADGADSYAVAAMLKAAVEKLGGVDLILCGEGSEDMYCQQVSPMLGAMLGWTTVNSVGAISRSGDVLILERSLEDREEVLEAGLPAVVCVTVGTNTPRIPSLKDIMAAGKKPYTVWDASELGGAPANAAETTGALAPEMTERRCEVLHEASEENIETFYQQLRRAL